MGEEHGVVAALTLPPKVVGKVSGHLVMKVDEVLWARKPPGDVSAVVMWWGGDEPTTFRPTDIAQDALREKNTGVIYEVRTSPVLFENYLRKCGSLEIAMADKYGMPIGCVSVTNLYKMMSESPYQSYYPIVNNFGNRIGDLHVSFNLRMLTSAEKGLNIPKLPSKLGVKTKDLKRLSPGKGKQPAIYAKSKEEKTKRNEKVLNDTCVNKEGWKDKNTLEEPVQNRVSPTSNLISQILEHGTRLRDAMTASVMEDGLHLNCERSSDLDVLLSGNSELFSGKGNSHAPSSNIPVASKLCGKKNNPIDDKKIRDYLSGKPMSEVEEEEALAALRSMTPTKDILEHVPDSHLFQQENTVKTKKSESSEIVTDITDYLDKSPPVSDVKFNVDLELLSQINCVRLTVHSLMLNTVGIKRVASLPKKKSCLSQSNISVHPPGVTYFVEYKFPLASGSRPWESTVRYCSKRIDGYEVAFGDRTVHNLPVTWRSSISAEANVGSLISALSFKVCARHLHQRVSIPLGIASPNSAKELIESAYLRHEFDLPVVASDHLPVAQLRVCIEFGRDRIHFGGLFDPDNNSLGIRSPRKTSAHLNRCPSSMSAKKKKPGKNVTTVTRNVAAKSAALHKLPSQQASQAQQLIQQLVANAGTTIKECTSAPSSGRSQLRPSRPSVPFQRQALTPDVMSSYVKPSSSDYQFIKHEVALTILQVLGKNYLKYSTADDKSFYVTYKFPSLNAMKSNSVVWHSYATEPSEFFDGTWNKPQNRIHTVVLPKNEAFHTYLQHSYEFHSPRSKSIVFSLCVRCYGTEVQDLPVAEATLPLTCLLTLENAYKDASRNNPNFSSSSCSSIVLDVPFELLPSYQSREPEEERGSLRLKVDYRSVVLKQSLQTANLPRSRGDSVSGNIPHQNFIDVAQFGGEIKLKLAPTGESEVNQLLNSPVSVPNWAKSSEKHLLQPIETDNIYCNDNGISETYQGTDLNQLINPPSANLHADWEPVQNKNKRPQSSGRIMQNSAYLMGDSNHQEDYECIADVIDKKRTEYVVCHDTVRSPIQSDPLNVHSQSLNIDSVANNVDIKCATKVGKADAATCTSPIVSYRHMSRGTSPTRHLEASQNEVCFQDRSTSMDTFPCHDKSEQASVDNVTQASQTSQRDCNDMVKEDAEAPTKSDNTPLKDTDTMIVKTDIESSVLPRCSIDDVETVEVVSEHGIDLQLSHTDKENCTHEKCEDISCSGSQILSSFTVKIGVESALHLQSTKPTSDGGIKASRPYVFVSINPCGLNGNIFAHNSLDPVSISPAVMYCDEPEWNWQTETQLPTDLLVSSVKRLLFKIWMSDQNSSSTNIQNLKSADLLGFSTLDLTVLSAGLPIISGWYNIMDFSGRCRGQIKLSLEPMEDISKSINCPELSFHHDTKSKPSLPMFVAHSTYSEFPSHVTQFPDMLVQKVDPQTTAQAASTIFSNYQLVVEQFQKLSSGHEDDPQVCSPYDSDVNASSSVSLQRKDESVALERQPQPDLRLNSSRGETRSTESSSLVDVDKVDKDPSVLLREKLSELDTITKGIKTRLLTRLESANSSGSQTDFPSKSEMNEQSSEETSSRLKQGCNKEDHVSRGSSATCQEKLLFPTSQTEERASYQKQRKTWEKQDDLIDFGALHIDCKDDNEHSPQNEDLSDWLSESALQQVFNPFLFNDILNCMNSSRGVQVIELDDTGTSDDNQDSPVVHSNRTEKSLTIEEESSMPSKCSRRRSRRGDETYRKENPHFVSNSPRQKSGPSAGDADSGVDVDVSATFQPGAFFPASSTDSFLPQRCMPGVRTASSEREESSSCSLSSRHYQSTLPSSASTSATPSDSPQHSQVNCGTTKNRPRLQIVLEKRNSSVTFSKNSRRDV